MRDGRDDARIRRRCEDDASAGRPRLLDEGDAGRNKGQPFGTWRALVGKARLEDFAPLQQRARKAERTKGRRREGAEQMLDRHVALDEGSIHIDHEGV